MILRLFAGMAGAFLLSCGAALAQGAFPAKPILMVIAFAPGGGTDITGRIVARRLGENLHQNVVVENRAGAGGNIATEYISGPRRTATPSRSPRSARWPSPRT